MKEDNDLKHYFGKSLIDYLFKRSLVKYYIGGLLGIAIAVASGGFSLDLTESQISINYDNELTALSMVVISLCIILALIAVRIQSKEKIEEIRSNSRLELKRQELSANNEIEKLRHELKVKEEKLRYQLAIDHQKYETKLSNLGLASNELLHRLYKIESPLVTCAGAGSLMVNQIDGIALDVYIANAVNDQHKFKKLYKFNERVLGSWNNMLFALSEAQRAISLSNHGHPLDTGALQKAAMAIPEYIECLSNEGLRIESNA